MNKKFRLMALILALAVFAMSLAACGGDKPDSTDTGDTGDTGDTSVDTGDDTTPIYSRGLDENGYFEGIRALDYVTLPEYKGIAISADLITANEDEIQFQLNDMLTHYADEITDPTATIEDGDTVNIDYVGYIDGEQFSGGNTGGLGTDVTIGVTNYIDDFLEQLIGHHPGDSFDIEVTFPEDYGKAELAGKDAVFKTTVNHIQGELILTDEIAAERGFASAEELLADLEDWVLKNARYAKFTEILKKATVSEVPQAVIDYLIALDIDAYEYYASMAGVSLETYLAEYTDYATKEEYIEGYMSTFIRDGQFFLAAQAIAEAEGITVTDAQIEEAGYNDLIAEMGLPYLRQYMLCYHILPEFIALNGVVE